MWREIFVKGGPVMYPLLLCSIVAVAVAIERAIFFARIKKSEETQADRLRAFHLLLAAGEYERAVKLLQDEEGPVERVLLAGLRAEDAGEAKRALLTAADRERRRLFGGLATLETIVTAAPLLGLLGTVTGILHTFKVLGGEPARRTMEAVGRGIAEALITTATGLVIAIPTLVVLNYFIVRAERTNEIMESAIACFEWRPRHGKILEAQSKN
ncbi:MAG: MotA/TolQ/ExbB proton channel family protein [Firmicutes bacterium]|nr:MotA/TolQ/ExbB proton channel family protein [Bacillota bacterium]